MITFLIADSVECVTQLGDTFKQHSILKFTIIEEGTGQHIKFFDVHVDATGHKFVTSTYSKPTCNVLYLNARRECLQTYKDGTIKALMHR